VSTLSSFLFSANSKSVSVLKTLPFLALSALVTFPSIIATFPLFSSAVHPAATSPYSRNLFHLFNTAGLQQQMHKHSVADTGIVQWLNAKLGKKKTGIKTGLQRKFQLQTGAAFCYDVTLCY